MRAFSRPLAPVRPFAASRGVALVVTLMMMSVLVMMVVGLAGVMRNEQAAARNLTYQVLADQLAEIGARAGMAAVQEISAGGSALPTATGPGWAYLNSERPLYSTGAVAAGRIGALADHPFQRHATRGRQQVFGCSVKCP